MPSPASGADGAADPPEYATIPQSEPGPQSATGRTTARGGNRRLGLALLVIATAQLMVVLDSTIVNVALPQVQSALGFSGSGLQWVVNAYAVTFGGLLLLGGRAGDILGRRRVFVFGLLLFSTASLLGGFATSEWWLLTARAVQGMGGAVIAPTALALITSNFPEGGERNRAFGIYAAMAGAGSAVGLLLGGILTTYVSWRWVMFVNVPIGILVAATAPRVLAESPRRPGRIDVAGAVAGTGGVALLVYGLSQAAAGADGVSHWGDAQVLASLTASVALLVSFVWIERRSPHPLLPMRVLADRNRSGANLIMLCIATALFGLFFFLTLFMQTVLGYSAIRSGIAYLPFAIGVVIASALASRLMARLGARPTILAGAAAVAGGTFWFSRLTEHSSYVDALLGPLLVTSFGLGLVFVPLSLVSLHNVAERDSGVASSLLNAGQQVGGAIGLALLGTVAWTAVANSVRSQGAQVGTAPPESIYNHALAVGFSRGFAVAAGVALLAFLIAIATIRVSRQELTGAVPEPQQAAPQPEAVQRHEERVSFAKAARPCRYC
ncbi:MFS transporter [Streptomyces endophyticus]|uniref:MFS transporter n=1 Tax=Streptomyces endophyticus TaxID=714166 RepID=A0ABU6EZ18_9ACTN|nr:MFS transporter [Streptomyces endophyticus]MEB8336980.1 MFS transporter [Streptomyces endophyticus]